MKYYFLSTRFEKGQIKVSPLAGQTYPGPMGVDVMLDPEFNVQCDKKIRAVYKAGTVFATDSITISADKKFYSAGPIFAVTNLLEDDKPAKEALDQYAALSGSTPKPFTAPAAPAAKTKTTYLQALKLRGELRVPTPEDGFYVPEDIWWLLIRNIENNIPTMLIGPTGSGKTEVVNFIRQRLKLSMEMHDMGSMVDAISNLIGVHRLKGGASVFDLAKFVYDIQQPGIVLLDELSRAPAGTNNVLFPLLDFRKELPAALAGSDDERVFKLHEECVLFATANIGSEYTGTSTMDRALIDRFFPVEVDYMPAAIETRLLMNRSRISVSDATIIAKVAENVRHTHKKGDLTTAISTRHTLAAADLVKDGFSTTVAMTLAFLPMFDGTNETGERSVVRNVISTR